MIGGVIVPTDEPVHGASVVELNSAMIDMLAEPMQNPFSNRSLINGFTVPLDLFSDCAVFEGGITSIDLDTAAVSFSLQKDSIVAEVVLNNTTAEMSGTADICGIEEEMTVSITNSTPLWTGQFGLSVNSAGDVVASMIDSEVDFSGAIMTSNVDASLAEHGITLEDIGFDAAVSTAIQYALSDTIPLAFPRVFNTITPFRSGVTTRGPNPMEYMLEAIYIDVDGIALVHSASIETDPDAINVAPGTIWLGVGAGERHPDVPVSASTSLNAINRSIHASWESGRLGAFVNAEDKGMMLRAFPTMPPVVMPGQPATMHIGELHISASDESDVLGRITVQAQAEISFTTDPFGNQKMVATVTDYHADTLMGEWPTDLEAAMDELLAEVFAAASPRFTRQFTIAAQLEPTGAAVTGLDDSWMTVSHIATPQ